MRELAKLFLNNLYGKMAASMDSSHKVAYIGEDDIVHFVTQEEYEKTPGYIAVGSAITSYARNFTIHAAQANYHGKEYPGFVYADTDSIHCDIPTEEIKAIRVHPSAFCCWKLESSWDTAIFARQKTYIEHVVAENQKPIETPYNNIKCAGMPEKCKKMFDMSMRTEWSDDEKAFYNKCNEKEKAFINERRTYKDFRTGLQVPGKLTPKRIKGGIVLVTTDYTMNVR